MSDDDVHSVGELLDRIDEATRRHEPTTFGDVLHMVGERSYGPLLLLAGLVMVAPVIGDIPGVPVMMGLLVILVTVQFLMKRPHFWLPGWMLRRSAKGGKIRKALGWMRPVGRFLDRWSRRRLPALTHGTGVVIGGIACMVVAMATPLMEVVPFSANVAGLAIAAYGLALIAADGVIAILAIAFSAGTMWLIVRQMIS